MKLINTSLDERCLNIYEYDSINDIDILIAKTYCIRKDGGIWELPSPQIFNQTIWDKNKSEYEDVIQSFRNDCQNLVDQPATLLQNQVTELNSDVDNLEDVSLDTDYQLLNLKIELDLIS